MKRILRTIFPAALLTAFLGGSALAQTKIATVDLGGLFTNYWRTQVAQSNIQERATGFEKDDTSMKNDLKKASDEYQQLLQQANDQAISAEERDRRKQAADDKLKQLEERRTALDQYEREAQTTLNDLRLRTRDKILTDVQAAVAAVAKAGGYTMVLDKSAEAVSVTPVIAYSSPEIDLTADVLKQLNAGAMIDVSPAASPPLVNTNGP